MTDEPTDGEWDAASLRPTSSAKRFDRARTIARFSHAKWNWTRTSRAQRHIALAMPPAVVFVAVAVWLYMARTGNHRAVSAAVAYFVLFLGAHFYRQMLDQATSGLFALRPELLDEFQLATREHVRSRAYAILAAVAVVSLVTTAWVDAGPALFASLLAAFFAVFLWTPRALGCWMLSAAPDLDDE